MSEPVRVFVCELCNNTILARNKAQDALDALAKNHPGVDVKSCLHVCGTCYNAVMADLAFIRKKMN